MIDLGGSSDGRGDRISGTDGLTPERMRRDVAEVLHLDPEEIGDDDDLIDLGLDSVRLMTLAVRWNNAGGRLSFAELAEHPVLRRWWEATEQDGDAQAG